MTVPPLTLKHWKRVEYERLVDLGLFRGDPVELIGGQLVVVPLALPSAQLAVADLLP